MSTKAKPTPGPWKVIPSPHGPKYQCVQFGSDDTYTSLEMLPADAKLCAAAPDLAAALKQIAVGAAVSYDGLAYSEISDIANRALKKAGL